MFRNETLDARQWIVLFIAGVTLCAIFFAFGLYVGKWSAGQSATSTMTPTTGSLLPVDPSTSPGGATGDSVASGLELPPERASSLEIPTDATPSPAGSPEGLKGNLVVDSKGTDSPPASLSTTGNSPESPKSYSVRAGIFDGAKEAEDLAAMLRSRGFVSAYVEEVKPETGTSRFQVLLGPWVDRESAARAMNELRNEGVSNVAIIGRP